MNDQTNYNIIISNVMYISCAQDNSAGLRHLSALGALYKMWPLLHILLFLSINLTLRFYRHILVKLLYDSLLFFFFFFIYNAFYITLYNTQQLRWQKLYKNQQSTIKITMFTVAKNII